MTTAEAAQKWAEAKETLGVAKAAFDSAHLKLEEAEKAEHEAWEALEELAGRVGKPAEFAQAAPANPFDQQQQQAVWRAVPRQPGIG